VFQTAFRHQLHADANAQEGGAGFDAGEDGLLQAVERFQSRGAVREGALAGQDDAVCAENLVRV